MRKAAAVIIVLLMCFALTGCGGTEPVFEQAGDASTAASGQLAVYTPQAAAADTVNFTRAKEVYADPTGFTGKAYSNLFQIISSGEEYNGATSCHAKSLTYIGALDAVYTELCFPGGMVRELSSGDIVYARGVIKGKGTVYLDSKTTADALIMDVSYMEYDAAKANIASGNAKYTFNEGEYKAVSGPLSVEITELFFSGNNTVVSTNTADSSLTAGQTYHFDIIVHQDGLFAWNYDCKFWIDSSSLNNYDYTLFPTLNGERDFTIEFAAFSRDGAVLYDPIVLSLKLSEQTESGKPTQTITPTGP